MHQGRITRIDSHGFGLIESTGGSQLAFTFDKLDGYRGEQPKDIGLKEGLKVWFTVHNGLINQVKITSETPTQQ